MDRRSLLCGAGALLLSPAALAQGAWNAWLQGVQREAMGKGVPAAVVDRAFTGLQPIERVLELDRHQPEFRLTWSEYLGRVVTEERVRRGRALFRENAALLSRTTGPHGVPAAVVVALWGVESNYGTRMGDFNVIAALATLAYNGRRTKYFRAELIAALRVLAGGHVPFERMVGSWAGAMGQCQFMPSSFLALAVDGDGDGKRDIWGSRADVFASAANYLRKAGWKAGVGWGAELRPGESMAGKGDRIVTPEGPGGRRYATTVNFRAIRRWNPADFFALSVGILSDRIAAA
ncbi:MAG: lytic murein transglycosylase [Alphaproteobacteria bacterium]|nr:lytic murein transglycosylase [Alphaproteobacteria bacterium]MCW5739977.1 lytic murein transglycosylase [Alphaproteobacteria bacterium]